MAVLVDWVRHCPRLAAASIAPGRSHVLRFLASCRYQTGIRESGPQPDTGSARRGCFHPHQIAASRTAGGRQNACRRGSTRLTHGVLVVVRLTCRRAPEQCAKAAIRPKILKPTAKPSSGVADAIVVITSPQHTGAEGVVAAMRSGLSVALGCRTLPIVSLSCAAAASLR